MNVLTTTNYSMFSQIDGNREKNLLHINRLKSSIKSNYLFTIIVVNEHLQIIDGQHRFEVIKELGLPLNYVICKGYGINEVHVLNQNSVTWNSSDYLDGYCKLGYQHYIIYKNFKEKYRIGHYECMALLNGSQLQNPKQIFYSGQFKVNSIEKATETIELIRRVEPYYPEWRRRSFIFAMIALMKNESFVFSEFISKLKLNAIQLVNCTTTLQYIELIERIYNYKRSNKINLRF